MNPIRVLIADDDADIREALADLISSDEGLELAGLAADAEEAIQAARSGHPDVILMDVRMPGGGGARATREIRSSTPLTKVVAISAYGDRPTVLEMLTAGAVGYVAKGAVAEEILESIHNAARGRSSVSPEISTEILRELSGRLEAQDRQEAMERARRARIDEVLTRSGGMRPVFQPVVELATGRIVGVEALTRFDVRPNQPPDRWFAEAAEVGRRGELELAAARLALARLHDMPPDAYVALNVSPETIVTPQFAETMAGFPPERVVLEITEHAPVEDYGSLQRALTDLRNRGARLAVDDAGAGFASLRHILQLDPDTIKLDLSLTRSIDAHRPRRALATALIIFAREIGAVVVAEGIETVEELEALRMLGVAYGQGYYLGPPQSLERALAPSVAPAPGEVERLRE